MTGSRQAARVLFAAAGLSAVGFALVTMRVRAGKMSSFDRAAQRRFQKVEGGPARAAARVTTPVGKWYAHLPAALASGRLLQRRGKTRGALAVVAASAGAAVLSRLLERALAHRAPPPERGEPGVQSYPSGHALESSALALTGSYVLLREGLAQAWVTAPFGLTALSAGAGRLLLARHWTSDVLGGYCAGIAWGATCAALYELGC